MIEQEFSVEGDVERFHSKHVSEGEYEEPDDVYAFSTYILAELIERVIPEKKRVLTMEKAAKCLLLLGKIWNLTECHEGCEIDSNKCQTSDERLLDMEGYVEEYQYLYLKAKDMALSDIRIIPEHFIWLLAVDVSGNYLTNISACPLTNLPNLVSLKLNRNRIVDPYLKPMKHLQYLGMNSNKIESLHRIYHPNLYTLDVSGNLISRIDSSDCWKLKKLRQLELRRNRLTSTVGIAYENLEALYLAENEITEIRGLECMPKLQKLHLRGNPLSSLSGFAPGNENLQYLNLRSCQITDVEELQKLQVLKKLSVLVVKENLFYPLPEARDEEEGEQAEEEVDSDIRVKILMMMPYLKRIDKKNVTREELLTVREMLEDQQVT